MKHYQDFMPNIPQYNGSRLKLKGWNSEDRKLQPFSVEASAWWGKSCSPIEKLLNLGYPILRHTLLMFAEVGYKEKMFGTSRNMGCKS